MAAPIVTSPEEVALAASVAAAAATASSGDGKSSLSSEASTATTDSDNNASDASCEDDDDASPGGPKTFPWYRRGGMVVNVNGMVLNIFIPFYVMGVTTLHTPMERNVVGGLLVALIALALCGGGIRTTYCLLVVPIHFVSLLFCVTIAAAAATVAGDADDDDGGGGRTTTVALLAVAYLTASLSLAVVKVNVCMSVCLHRYAAHHAFDCGSAIDVVLNVLGCLANQGGPLWWSSQHRCHHKHCDLPQDPHSPLQAGTERAFAFFLDFQHVDERFVPPHMIRNLGGAGQGAGTTTTTTATTTREVLIRALDTWAFLVVSCELYLSYCLFGLPGLYVAYTSGWVCQTITLWFNVVNHPPPPASKAKAQQVGQSQQQQQQQRQLCLATDDKDKAGPLASWTYPPWVFLDGLYPLFSATVMEGEHEHHHTHSTLAQRSEYDPAYWLFLFPLEQLGLVWNVQVLKGKKGTTTKKAR